MHGPAAGFPGQTRRSGQGPAATVSRRGTEMDAPQASPQQGGPVEACHMSLNPEARRARARLAAHRRWRPGDDLDQLTEECHRALEISRNDEHIDALVASAQPPTPEQMAKLSRLTARVASG